ncbi:MAG: YceI family protein [Bacteroidota bacterium]
MPNRNSVIATFIALFLFLGQGNFCAAQIQSFHIDESQSSVTFEATHLGVLKVRGQFQNFSGTLVFTAGELTQVESKIKVKSIDSGDISRDRSLLDEGYLNATMYPSIHFKSTSVKNDIITGVLTIKAVKKEMEIPYHLKKNKSGFLITMTTQLDRNDFNLDFGAMDALVGDKVHIELEIVGLPN